MSRVRTTADETLATVLEPRGTVREPWWRAYSRIVYRHRWPALAVLAAALLAGVAYLAITTPVYQAKTQLLIQVQTPEAIQFREAPDQEQLTTDDYQTQYGILSGVGIRVIDGDVTGYAYADEYDMNSLRDAARVAASIAARGAAGTPKPFGVSPAKAGACRRDAAVHIG